MPYRCTCELRSLYKENCDQVHRKNRERNVHPDADSLLKIAIDCRHNGRNNTKRKTSDTIEG